MRKFVASLAVLALAGTAMGQTVYSCPSALEYKGLDDGSSERIWKIQNPSGPSDYFSVDFDTLLDGCTVVAMAPAVDDSSAALNPTFARVGLYGDNLTLDSTGNTPDLNAGVVVVNGGGIQLDRNCNFTPYTSPTTVIGSTNLHGVFQHANGDSSFWLCGDESANTGNNYFTTDGFATLPTQYLGSNWMIRAGVIPSAASAGAGTLLVNGAAAATATHLEAVAFSMYGDVPGGLWALFTAPPLPSGKVGPILPFGFGGPLPNASTLCGSLACNAPVGIPLTFNAFWLNAAMKIKKSSVATLTGSPNAAGCGFCFGQQDDGAMDAYAFKASQPAGTQDWFSVRHGTPSPASGVNNLTGVQNASWDFCGTGGAGAWSEIGIYPADLAADPTGIVPDLNNAVATVGPAPITPGAGDWGYPDTHAYGMGTNAVSPGTIYHSAVSWIAGDSCMWIGTDTNATGPDPCGTIPNTSSSSSTNDYANFNVYGTTNWIIAIDWN